MSQRRVAVVTLGVMLSLFMAAVEVTVVATAMPSIVNQLGGLARYSWVFSAYMVASTTTIPLYGKFSDIYGRKPVFLRKGKEKGVKSTLDSYSGMLYLC